MQSSPPQRPTPVPRSPTRRRSPQGTCYGADPIRYRRTFLRSIKGAVEYHFADAQLQKYLDLSA